MWTVYQELFHWGCWLQASKKSFSGIFVEIGGELCRLSRSDLQIYPGELPSLRARGNFICRGQIGSNCSSISLRVILEETARTSQKVGRLIQDSWHSWIIIFPIRACALRIIIKVKWGLKFDCVKEDWTDFRGIPEEEIYRSKAMIFFWNGFLFSNR